ncbi:hypothetical protein [Xanthobacter agilis]|uniref:hypothetical protein n=1 Tax=Xanthobacter agilis TaxID=47492 RepID=UPI00372BC350
MNFNKNEYDDDAIVSPAAVQSALGITRWTYRRRIKDGGLPKPDIYINRQCVGHKWSSIVNAICKHFTNNDGAASPLYGIIVLFMAIFSFFLKIILL